MLFVNRQFAGYFLLINTNSAVIDCNELWRRSIKVLVSRHIKHCQYSQIVMYRSFCVAKVNRNVTSALTESNELHVGEWCVFKIKSRWLIGMVLGFCYTAGKTFKSRQYAKSSAFINNTTPPVGVLGMWYSWTSDGKLIAHSSIHSHVGIENYKRTIPAPSYSHTILQINDEIRMKLIELQK